MRGGAARALATGGVAAMVYLAKPSGLATILACAWSIAIALVIERRRWAHVAALGVSTVLLVGLSTVSLIAVYAAWRVFSGQPLLPYGTVLAEIVPTLLSFDVGRALYWETLFFGQVALMSGGGMFVLALVRLSGDLISPMRERWLFALLSSSIIVAVVTVGAWFNGYLNGWLVERHVFVVLPLVLSWAFMGISARRAPLRISVCAVLSIASIVLIALAPEYEFFTHAATLFWSSEPAARLMIVGVAACIGTICAAAVVSGHRELAVGVGVVAFLGYNLAVVAVGQYTHYARENSVARASKRPIATALCSAIVQPANILYVGQPGLPMKDQIIKDYLYACRDHRSILDPRAFAPDRPSYVVADHGVEPPADPGRRLDRLGSWGQVTLYRVAPQ
jgi:hypothetical protein